MQDLKFETMKINLILSGGGFRATLFHLGAVKHLVNLGLFNKIRVISSVSGGSILNALISLHFDDIKTEKDFIEIIERPILKMVKNNLRNNIFLNTLFSIKSKSIKKILDKKLFHNKTLSDLSMDITSIFNATDINQGRRFLFSQYRFGGFDHAYSSQVSQIPLSKAVCASMAFPGLISPEVIKKEKYNFPLKSDVASKVQLIDGGVYDNTGIFGAREFLDVPNTLNIVSDTIEVFSSTKRKLALLNQFKRVLFIVLDLKTRKERSYFVNRLQIEKKEDESWKKDKIHGIIFLAEKNCNYYRNYTSPEFVVPNLLYGIPANIGFSEEIAKMISIIRTDLNKFSQLEIDCLMYHGASLLDVNLRKWYPEIYDKSDLADLPKPNYSTAELKKGLSKSDKSKIFG